MSPENQQPNSPQGIKDLINTSTHPEGIRDNFTTPLSEAAPKIEEEGMPKNVSAIDPITHEVEFTPFDKEPVSPEQSTPTAVDQLGTEQLTPAPDPTPVPRPVEAAPAPAVPEVKKRRKGLRAVVAAAVAAVGLGGYVGVKALGGNDEVSPIPTTPTASAPVVPGPTETGSTTNESESAGVEQQPEALIGHPNTSFEKANVTPSKEAIEKAVRPILASEYTPEEAAQTLLRSLDIYLLSGQLDETGTNQTTESIEQGARIEQNLFGTQELQQSNGVSLTDLRTLRANIASAFGYMNGIGLPLRTDGSAATYHHEYVLSNHIQNDENTDTFTVTTTTYSNFNKLDTEWTINSGPVTEELTITKVDGRYISKSFHEVN